MRLILAFLALIAAPAWANGPMPQLHDVTGVADDDVLNIRAEPSASAPIIGGLAPDATDIEVIRLNEAGTWGLVNDVEQSGWVSMAFMEPRGVHIDNFNLPVGMRCFGTEPFWSLTHTQGTLTLDELAAEDPRDFDLTIAQDRAGIDVFTRMIRALGDGGAFTALVEPRSCNDGMSDRNYGLMIRMMAGDTAPLLDGCCSLQPLD